MRSMKKAWLSWACAIFTASMLVAGCVCTGTNNAAPTPSPTASPPPVMSAQLSDWGTDRDVYARGDTATGWVNVTNTGNVAIDEVNFTVTLHRTILFVGVERSFGYIATGLNIAPGETRRVEFSQAIPAEYEGVSTAGDYRLEATARVGGTTFPAFSKAIRIT